MIILIKVKSLIKKNKLAYIVEGALEPNSQHLQALVSFQNGTLYTLQVSLDAEFCQRVYFNHPSHNDLVTPKQ